jgi:DNA polymerase I
VLLQLGNENEQLLIDTRKLNPSKFLKQLLTDSRVIVGHNLQYDYQVLKTNYDIELENVWDTMLAAQILECGPDREKGHFTLESVVGRYVRPYYTAQLNLFIPPITKKIRESFASIKEEKFTIEQLYYAALDIETASLCYRKLKELLKENDLEDCMKLENEFLKVLSDMSLNGMPIKHMKWVNIGANYKFELEELSKKLVKYSPIN